IRELKVKLEKGESQPPVRAASDVRREPPRPESPEPRAEAPASGGAPGGGVTLRVEPRDATVYVDGEYRGSARDLPSLRLPAGRHRVELARPGFQPLEKDFEVEADRTIDLRLSMERGGGWKY
ncbi:MAG TPA: PEGA domain-containing protein, partial [Vicinamibacteria bacterium]|nr:PEGA domain-containing protein [Vicinamibacteria bacterium]